MLTPSQSAFFECFAIQAKEPFDDETLSYIQSLDTRRDVQLLRDLDFQETCIATYRFVAKKYAPLRCSERKITSSYIYIAVR